MNNREAPPAFTRDDLHRNGFVVKKAYETQGFVALREALEKHEIEELLQANLAILRGEHGSFEGWEGPHPDLTSDELLNHYLCVHFPDRLADVFKRYKRHASVVETLKLLIGRNVKCMQTMLFNKGPGGKGHTWHQDEYFIPTRDRSLVGVWIALDDATIDNGCLWVIPGSHRRGIIWPQREHGRDDYDCYHEAYNTPFEERDAVAVEVEMGAIVFFNGYLLHSSQPNVTDSSFRRALVYHCMSAESLLPWGPPEPDLPVGRFDYRDIEIIAGKDPYFWKPKKDLAKVHVRPKGDGGCEDWQQRGD